MKFIEMKVIYLKLSVCFESPKDESDPYTNYVPVMGYN